MKQACVEAPEEEAVVVAEVEDAKGTEVGTTRVSEVDGEARAEVEDKEPHASHHVNHSPESERAADSNTAPNFINIKLHESGGMASDNKSFN